MKIAMIGHKRIPSREGGVEIVVEELATRLVNKNYEVDVYNRKGNNVSDKNIKMQKIKEYNWEKAQEVQTVPGSKIDVSV